MNNSSEDETDTAASNPTTNNACVETKSESGQKKCRYCQRIFAYRKSFENHLIKCKLKEKLKTKADVSNLLDKTANNDEANTKKTEGGEKKCSHCERTFMYRKSLENHLAKCGFKDINRKSKLLHFEKIQKPRLPTSKKSKKVNFLCSGCKYIAKTIKGMIRHREKFPICGALHNRAKKSDTMNNYAKFKLSKIESKVQCQRCDRFYLNSKSLHLHKASCKSNAARRKKSHSHGYRCKICNRCFILESACIRHVKMHQDNPHLLRGGGKLKKLDPASWGYAESKVIINSSTFDDGQIMEILLSEFRNEIAKRKNDKSYKKSQMMTAAVVFECIFIKLENFNSDIDDENNENVVAYFHGDPIRMVEGNLDEKTADLIATVHDQIEEYQQLGSGMILSLINQIHIKYYSYSSMIGGSASVVNTGLLLPRFLYTHGKVMDLNYSNYSPDLANAVDLKEVEINLQNEEKGTDPGIANTCFEHCLILHDYVHAREQCEKTSAIDKHGAKVGSYFHTDIYNLLKYQSSEKVLDKYCMKHVNRPMNLDMIPLFQKDNLHINITILQLEVRDDEDDVMYEQNDLIELPSSRFVLTQYYISHNDSKDCIHLLYWSKTSHFYYITNLRLLVLSCQSIDQPRIKSELKLCRYCLSFIDTRYYSMSMHEELCRSKVKNQITTLPINEQDASWEFKDYALMNESGIFVAADFECSVKKIHPVPLLNTDFVGKTKQFSQKMFMAAYKRLHDDEQFPTSLSEATQPVQVHNLNTVGYSLHIPHDYKNFPHYEIDELGGSRGILTVESDAEESQEKLVHDFIILMNKFGEIVRNYMEMMNDEVFQKSIVKDLSELPQIKKLRVQTRSCGYCKKPIVNEKEKVLDHCHYTLAFRRFAHSKCNLEARNPVFKDFSLPIYFHNLSSYDHAPILRYARPDVWKSNTSSVFDGTNPVWKCRTRGAKVVHIQCGAIQFKDSYQLLPLKLEEIGKNLPSKARNYLNTICRDAPGKGLYPYEFIDSISKFDLKEFPSINDFTSSISGSVSKEQYDEAKTYFDNNCNTFKDYHDTYLNLDVAILADGLIYWRDLLMTHFQVDLLQCASLPAAAKNCMLQMCRPTISLIKDRACYDIFTQNVRGGLTISGKRVTTIPKDDENQQIKYFDIKSLYSYIETLRHPVGDVKLITPTPSIESVKALALSYNSENDVGYTCVCSWHTPKHLHPLFSDFPIIQESRIIDRKHYPSNSEWSSRPTSRVKKLIPHLFDVDNYGVTIDTVKFLLSMGIVLTKVTAVIQYTQKAFMKDFVEICQTLRRNGKKNGIVVDKAYDVLWKLVCNATFGKFIESPYNYENSAFVFTRSRYEKFVQNLRFKSATFHNYGALCRSRPKEICLNKPVMIGYSILCRAKLHMMQLYYYRILPSYVRCVSNPADDKLQLRLLYMDTDSIVVHLHLKPSQELKFYHELKDIFDFSDIPQTDKLYSTHNSTTIGVFKDESKGRIIVEFYTTSAKSYWVQYKDALKRMIKNKGVPHFVQENQLSLQDFIEAFKDSEKRKKIVYHLIRISQESRRIYTVKCRRKTLNTHDSKRYVINNGYDSLAMGHYAARASETV